MGLFAVASFLFCLWYLREQNEATVEAADLRVSQAIADAKQWLASEDDLAKWKVVEADLVVALSNDLVSNKQEGQTILELVGQRAHARQMWHDARQLAQQGRGHEAAALLRKYVLLARAEHLGEAQWILDELETANSDAKAMATLLALDEASFLELEKTGIVDDPRVTRPELKNILNVTIQRMLPLAKVKRANPEPPELTVPSKIIPKELLTNSIGMDFVLIPTGTFTMGSPAQEEGRSDDETQYEVTISGDYFLGVYEVTQAQYQHVMGNNPSGHVGLTHPVEQVSWEEAVEFCKRLSELRSEQMAGRSYRLPTEAEWEYACRAGTSTKYGYGEDELLLGDVAWFIGNSQGRAQAVGQKNANAWGLHDMHGNVFEWCADRYGKYPSRAVTDPRGDTESQIRLIRGGGWGSAATYCRAAYRFGDAPSRRSNSRGFRVAMDRSGQELKDLPNIRAGQIAKAVTNSVNMELVLIPAGTFAMGSPTGEAGRDINETQHEVTIKQEFYLGAYEVTQAQYREVMGKNPSHFAAKQDIPDSSNHPVEQVTWEEADEFCRRLSTRPEEKAAGRVYRLPTEAEWEYACRANSITTFSFGNEIMQLDEYAWYQANCNRTTQAVGQKKPNAWGLYDMHGNVGEWCADWYALYPPDAGFDPTGPANGTYRVYRGGSWLFDATGCRTSYRYYTFPTIRSTYCGFRVALNVRMAE
ncbi:MAG: formylglycine-generating enzyme family protein [Planctomycetaceae bacterium]|nr:formylglycine-generating enzyme family protein [Planctomycetaceae bacterium]